MRLVTHILGSTRRAGVTNHIALFAIDAVTDRHVTVEMPYDSARIVFRTTVNFYKAGKGISCPQTEASPFNLDLARVSQRDHQGQCTVASARGLFSAEGVPGLRFTNLAEMLAQKRCAPPSRSIRKSIRMDTLACWTSKELNHTQPEHFPHTPRAHRIDSTGVSEGAIWLPASWRFFFVPPLTH